MNEDILRKYTEDERLQICGGCYDCKLLYEQFPADLNIQDELWEKINPSPHRGGGLLCPNCICRRLIALGLTAIRVTVDLSELVP